jgi:hypothetical protein
MKKQTSNNRQTAGEGRRPICSARELARLIGRSQTAVHKWLHYTQSWPFKREPPWPRSIVPKVKQWMKTLPPDPAASARQLRAMSDEDLEELLVERMEQHEREA